MTNPRPASLTPGEGPLDVDWLRSEAARLSNEGRWGDHDELGTWNLVTPAKRLEALSTVRTGNTYNLAIPLGPDMATAPGRPAPIHFLTLTGTDATRHGTAPPVSFADDWITMNLSAGTQWDGFAHVFSDGTTYNCTPASAVSAHRGAERGSVSRLAPTAVTRAVLLDVPRVLGRPCLEPGQGIGPALLDETLDRAGTSLGPGDVALVRTGALARVRDAGDWAGYAGIDPQPGLHASAAAWIAERDLAAVASDTWGLEVLPYSVAGTLAPLHQILLGRCGITIGEMFDLDTLAEDCATDGAYEMLLVAPPLPIVGAVSSPLSPIALR